ncbi:AlpA family phage regulatory protein [Aliidiomarina halalkaliphila]|uniref:AlpA family phage regulatory protein n=1 Tax=Aliidiomarina halalkaliphila TaxID=2593535 RepID=A0A552WZW7_9GAMM|nr:AlpA family phage regulatory protein [Aliidiomarina halalkaliphila]TRW48352.1 AlpA family phage regulatory protein [Aliidiomarina halalkaliphila]
MRLIKLEEVRNKTTLSRTTIYKLVVAKSFPKPVTVVGRSRVWVEEEIDEWIRAKIAERLGTA